MGAIPYGSGVTFRVWAPFATSVSVRGTFNSWGQTPLVSESNGNWSVDVNGAAVGQEYKYYLNGTTYKRDPRARSVTSSAGNSIIYDPNAFDWGASSNPAPARNDLVLYQMHVGTFEGGSVPQTFDDAIAKLDHVQSLGVNAIKLMPINEFPGGLSWGYNPADLFAVENEYGGPDALKRFVKACHERGIEVFFDVVHNHYGPTDLAIWQFDGWSQNGFGGIYFYNDDRAYTPWGSTRPDFGRPEVYSFIRDQIAMFVQEYRAGGFRWDSVYNIINTDLGANQQGEYLLRDINWELSQNSPNVVRGAEDNAFDYSMNFENQWDVAYRWDLHGQIVAATDADRNMGTVAGLLANWPGLHRVVFSEAHDYIARNNNRSRIPSEVDPSNPFSIWARKRGLLAAGIVMTTPGIPMLFQGQEMNETNAFHDDMPLHWTLTNTYAGIVRAYGDLVHARRNLYGGMQGLKGSGINVHHIDNNNKVVAYIRWDAGGQTDDAVVVANFAATKWTNGNYLVEFPSEGTWYRHFNSDAQDYQSDFDDIGSAQVLASGTPPKAAVDMGMYSLQIYSKTPPVGMRVPSSVAFDPPAPAACENITITYDPGTDALQDASPVYIHIGRNGWQGVVTPDPAMTALTNGLWQYVFSPPSDTYQIDMVFTDGASAWDNNDGQDWHLSLTNCGPPPPEPSVEFTPAAPAACDPVAITFDPTNGVLQDAAQVYIEIGRNGWQDVIVPHPAMTSLGDGRWQYTYATPWHTDEINLTFHNGSNVWENNDGLNWSLVLTNCNAGPPAALAFATPPQTLAAGATSDVITVVLRDSDGNEAVAASELVAALHTTSAGAFLNATSDVAISQIAIPAGQSQAGFRYTSAAVGEHGLAVSNAALSSATQLLTVTAETTLTFDQSGTFTVPAGVTNLLVQAWGGGGGPRNDGTSPRSGGGGGAYALANIPVVSGSNYAVVVGAGGAAVHLGKVGNPGSNSFFGDGTLLLARGGSGGARTGGAGGAASNSIGAAKYSGGNGGSNGSFTGGAGGGSAFTNANGTAGENGPSISTQSALGGAGTGTGGNGGANVYPGSPGQVPGGGGGARGNNGGNGGNGASGRVIITYQIATAPPSAPGIVTQPASQSVMQGDSVSLSVVATGSTPFAYAWFKDGAPHAGGAASLSFNPVQLSDAGAYHVVVSNLQGAATSAVATLAVAEASRVLRLSGDGDFGTVVAGETAQRTLTIWNDGADALHVSGIAYPSGFSGAWTGEVAAGGSRNVSIAFSPAAAGTYSGGAAVNSDATAGTNTWSVRGTAIAAGSFYVLITNPAPDTATVDFATSAYAVQGRVGTGVVGQVSWTNSLTGGSGTSALAGTNFSLAPIPLGVGTNVIAVVGTNAPAAGGTLAQDDAGQGAYADGWTTGDDGGTGFGPWTLGVTGSAGHWRATQAANANLAIASNAWGMWANSGGLATAGRAFDAALQPGHTFRIKFENGWIDAGSSVGFALQNSSNEYLLEFMFVGGASTYQINDATAGRDSGIGWTDAGLDIAIDLASATNYTLRVGAATITGTLATRANMQVGRLHAWNNNAGAGDSYNAYFADLAVTNPPGAGGATGDVVSIVRRPDPVSSFTLTILSDLGTPSPAAGIHTNPAGTVVTNSVAAPEPVNGTRLVCAGWTMTGHAPASGTSNLFAIAITNHATLQWQWTTNYWLETSSGGNGSVALSSSWQAAGATVSVAAAPNAYYHLSDWTGDASGSANPLDLAMAAPRSVQANFAENLATNQTPEWWLAENGWSNDFDAAALADSDFDGRFNWQEYVADTDPTNPASFFPDLAAQGSATNLRFNIGLTSTQRHYYVDRSTNLHGIAQWSNVTNAPGTGGIWTPQFSAPSPGVYFFRSRVALPP